MDPTQKHVKELNNASSKYTTLFNDTMSRSMKHISASAPEFTGLPKYTKITFPIDL